MIDESRLIVTFRTCHLLVAGGPPGLHIGIHLVTESTEGGRLRKFQKTSNDDEENNEAKSEENFYSLMMSFSSLPGSIEDIDPKGLY
jgi:hypothetical protein